jgi:hypothetical protein
MMKPIEIGHTPNGNSVILIRSSDPTSFNIKGDNEHRIVGMKVVFVDTRDS